MTPGLGMFFGIDEVPSWYRTVGDRMDAMIRKYVQVKYVHVVESGYIAAFIHNLHDPSVDHVVMPISATPVSRITLLAHEFAHVLHSRDPTLRDEWEELYYTTILWRRVGNSIPRRQRLLILAEELRAEDDGVKIVHSMAPELVPEFERRAEENIIAYTRSLGLA